MRFDVNSLTLFGIDLSGAWSWWVEGLRPLQQFASAAFLRPLPSLQAVWDGQRIRLADPREPAETLVELDAAGLAATADAALADLVRAHFARNQPVRLEFLVDESLVIQRPMNLPPVSQSRMRDMLRFQLPRLTPLPPERLLFGLEQATERRSGGLLVAVPREQVDKLVADVQRVTSMPVSRLAVYRKNSELSDLSLNMLDKPREPVRWFKRLNGNFALLVMVLLLSMAAVAVPLLDQRAKVIERKQQIQSLHGRVAETMEKRDLLVQRLEVMQAMLASRSSLPATRVLEELSRIVPDNIYIADLRILGDQVTFTGNGQRVVELIETLNASPLFRDARFASAVRRNQRTGLDQFSVSLSIVKEPVQP